MFPLAKVDEKQGHAPHQEEHNERDRRDQQNRRQQGDNDPADGQKGQPEEAGSDQNKRESDDQGWVPSSGIGGEKGPETGVGIGPVLANVASER